MNILLAKLPDSIEAGSKSLKVKTDYREWINLELTLENVESSAVQKLNCMMKLLLDNLEDVDESFLLGAINGIMSFYNCGKPNNDKNENTPKIFKKIYSYDIDQDYIYTDFIRYYDIDLSNTNLHWWKFRKLFLELPDDSKTKTIMMYRSIIINSKMSKEHKSFYLKMKKIYSLDKGIPKENKAKKAGSILAGYMTLDKK